jgi:hypothetical protein
LQSYRTMCLKTTAGMKTFHFVSGSPGPSSDHSSRASSPLFDSGLHLNGHCSHTVSTCNPPT